MPATTVNYKVEGMTCGHCKSRVETTAKGVSGVKDARVDLAKGTMQVDQDPDSNAGVIAALNEAGYPTKQAE